MKKYIIIIIMLSITMHSCTEKKKDLPTDSIMKEVFTYALDSLINIELTHYDICGIFNSEFSEDLILKSLIDIDSILTEEDKSYILKQYREKKGKDIRNYINESNYNLKEGSDYYPEDSLNYHLSFTVPLFTLNNKYAVLYHVGRTIKVNSTIDDFYFLFRREQKNWVLVDVIKNSYTRPNVEIHSHPYSIVPRPS